MRRPSYIVTLSNEDRNKLLAVKNNKHTSKTYIRRAQLLLEMDVHSGKSLSYTQIAKSFGVTNATLTHIAKEYSLHGLDHVITYQRNPNSNAKRKADGSIEARLIQMACGPVPEGHSRWTLRLMEEKSKIELVTPVSRETIRQVLKKMNYALI